MNNELKKYIEFMKNPHNFKKCDECPHKDDGHKVGRDGVQGPCGQQHCWVGLHQ